MGENSTENQKKKLESFIKSQRERLDEIDDLKKSSKTIHDDIFKLNKDLNLLTKENKMKQKVNFILCNPYFYTPWFNLLGTNMVT